MGVWEYAGTTGNIYSFAHAFMEQIRKQNAYFVTKHFVRFVIFTFRALGVESFRVGAITPPPLVSGRSCVQGSVVSVRSVVCSHFLSDNFLQILADCW